MLRPKSVADIVEELEAIGSPAEAKTFLILMRVYCRGDMFIFAREVFDEMGRRGFVRNTLARNLIIDGLFKSGLRPTVEIWRILIVVLCQVSNVPLGFGLFGKIIDSGCLPTVVTYTLLIKGLLKARMLSEAIGVWDIMVIASVAVDCPLAALDTKLY
ncbi:uncharacterized protein A4U43_C05F24050 [Asparagus officinalis]|uniref:Pentacotripeptide-repeat region of PRORP domain-containing protein n=1 Tax=Asparagus officinalis TaxID=4686 RepID=A0A5P1EZF7_ASPOF|nr:uncharacterized protein A4U43_C05F24050 [Asparagus officinalis]